MQSFARPCLVFLGLAWTGGVAQAWGPPVPGGGSSPRFYVSTTDTPPPIPGLPPLTDGDVLLVSEADEPRAVMRSGHWLAAAGLDPGDIDALARRPGSTPGTYRSLAFSTLSNVGGYQDGDILGLAEGGGLELLVAESALTQALGVPGAAIDVDACAWDPEGRLHVSLQSDLPGTVLGKVLNGDILRLEFDGTIKRVLTEVDIEEKIKLATGTAYTVGDVHGLELVSGEAWVTVQSPSGLDGGVLDCGQNPSFVLTEAGAGLGGAELDALMRVFDADLLPVVDVDRLASPAGGQVKVSFQGQPGALQLVLWAGDDGFVSFPGAGGFGAWYLDPSDPWLGTLPGLPTLPLAPLDGAGTYEVDYDLPPATEGVGPGGALGWSFQTLDLVSLKVSAPVRLELL